MNTIIETHPLKPFLPLNTKTLILGSFPPPKSRWKIDFYYPNYQNDMWRILGLCFFNNKNYFLDIDHKSFYIDKILSFLEDYGIAIYDTAYKVKRLQSNASDKYLQIETATDIVKILEKIPDCKSILTTGDKATETLLHTLGLTQEKIKIGSCIQYNFQNRTLSIYRLSSSSRAYPLPLTEKAKIYVNLFKEINLL